MPLLDVQRSLVGFARGSQDAFQQAANLTSNERDWLFTVLNSPGLKVTQQIQQWWRIARICSTARLTIEMLKRNKQIDVIVDYIIHEPIHTLFFAAELEQFKNFIQQNRNTDETTKSLIAFESAIKTALQIASGNNRSEKNKFPMQLTFWRDPVKLFAALLTSTPLPEEEPEPYYVEINPELESLWKWRRRLHSNATIASDVASI